tara:strand:- start:8 stop:484 length:477 start_codon:yes stop_codon:yes gene_type:complete
MERRRPDVATTRRQLSKRRERIPNRGTDLSRTTSELEKIGRETTDVGQRSRRVEQIRGKEQTRRGREIGTVEIDIEFVGADCRVCSRIFSGVKFYERFREITDARQRVVDIRLRGIDGARRRVDVELDGVVYVHIEFNFKERKIVRVRGRGSGVSIPL